MLGWEKSFLVVDGYETADNVTGTFAVKQFPLPTRSGVVQGARLTHMLTPVFVSAKLLYDAAEENTSVNVSVGSCAKDVRADFVFSNTLHDDVLDVLVLDLTDCNKILELGDHTSTHAQIVQYFRNDERAKDLIKAFKKATDLNFPQLRSLKMTFFGATVYE